MTLASAPRLELFQRTRIIARTRTKWYEPAPDKAFWLFVGYATLVFMLGGGSRHDIESLGPLRAFSAIGLAIAIYWQTRGTFARVAVPVYLLLALAGVMVLQLIPLPPDIWQSLADRGTIARIGELVGAGDAWRPITLSPQRTFNSLASLVVPLAGLLMLGLLDAKQLRKLVIVVMLFGLASAIVGILQVVVPSLDALYFYRITNSDSAVGLFSNRNHNALFLNIALLFSLFVNSYAEKTQEPRQMRKWEKTTIIAAVRLVIVTGILINASRFGLVLLALNGLVFAWLAFAAREAKPGRNTDGRWKVILGGAAVAGSVLLIGLFTFLSRIPALDRAFEGSLSEDQRLQTLPVILGILKDHFPFGVGFGAFEQAFRIVEPAEALRPRYLNHAHNDWLQVLVEGGLAAAVILALALVWLLKTLFATWRAKPGGRRSRRDAQLGALSLLMIALHSVLDYPLRTPSLMIAACIAIALVASAAVRARELSSGETTA